MDFQGVSSCSVALLIELECGIPKMVDLKLDWVILAISEKYQCLSASLAVILSAGSQANNLQSKSISSLEPFGNSFQKPIPFFCGKLNQFWLIWVALFLNKSIRYCFGVPNTLLILWIWSSYPFPLKRGYLAIISNSTQPYPQISIFESQQPSVIRHQGALYQRVEMYSVQGCLEYTPNLDVDYLCMSRSPPA